MIFKNRLKRFKRKCFSDLRQKQPCSHGVKDGCKNLQRFSFKLLKPFCLSSEQSLRKGVLRNFGKFMGKHHCQNLFFNKVADLRPATLLKKRLWLRCFPENFAKFLRTPLDDSVMKFFEPFFEVSNDLSISKKAYLKLFCNIFY